MPPTDQLPARQPGAAVHIYCTGTDRYHNPRTSTVKQSKHKYNAAQAMAGCSNSLKLTPCGTNYMTVFMLLAAFLVAFQYTCTFPLAQQTVYTIAATAAAIAATTGVSTHHQRPSTHLYCVCCCCCHHASVHCCCCCCSWTV